MNVWAAVVTVAGSLLTFVGVAFTGRATVRAAAATARANEAATAIQTEPSQRAEDRAAFEAVKAELRAELTACRDEVRSLRSLVRAFAVALIVAGGMLVVGALPRGARVGAEERRAHRTVLGRPVGQRRDDAKD